MIRILCEDVEWIISGQGSVAGSCDHGSESSGSVKDAEFLE